MPPKLGMTFHVEHRSMAAQIGTSPETRQQKELRYSAKEKLSLAEIEGRLRAAGYKLSGLTDIKPGVQNSRGRLKQVILEASKGGFSLSGDQFRKAVGYGVIKSTRFTVKISNGEASFSGTGNGHGVGLCQWGAKQRALDGFGYGEILSYYYPGTELKKYSDIR